MLRVASGLLGITSAALLASGPVLAQTPRPTLKPAQAISPPPPAPPTLTVKPSDAFRSATPLPPKKPAAASAQAPEGYYSIELVQIEVSTTTLDDALNLDGWGDEIYAQAVIQDMTNVSPGAASPAPVTVRTFNLGDLSASTPDGNRKLAGSGRPADSIFGSSRGGIMPGDHIFHANDCDNPLGTGPMNRCLPMPLWQGKLVKGQTGVVITPEVWEFDPVSPAFNFASSFLAWQASTSVEVRDSNLFTAIMPIGQVYVELTALGTPHAIQFLNNVLGKPGSRPIGFQDIGGGKSEYQPKSVLFTYDYAETYLQPGHQSGGIEPGIVQIPFPESAAFGGSYALYLKITKLS